MPLLRALLLAPTIFAVSYAVEGQRFRDDTTVFSIDHEMDARLNPYVSVVRGTPFDGDRPAVELLHSARLWRDGRLSGTLRDPMPARYGDDDGAESARSELVTTAMRLSGDLVRAARETRSRSEALALFRAAAEPIRTVQYADVQTVAKVSGRRLAIAVSMRKSGFAEEEILVTMEILKPDQKRITALFRHMSKLRNQFRVRFSDEGTLRLADPYFERIVRGEHGRKGLLVRG